MRRRVRVFGEPTPGAADHVTPIRVTPTVVALIPEATPADAVSGHNWEGTGVTPDHRLGDDVSLQSFPVPVAQFRSRFVGALTEIHQRIFG